MATSTAIRTDYRINKFREERQTRPQYVTIATAPRPPTGMSSLIRHETGKDLSGSSTCRILIGMRQLRIRQDPQLWWHKRGAPSFFLWRVSMKTGLFRNCWWGLTPHTPKN